MEGFAGTIAGIARWRRVVIIALALAIAALATVALGVGNVERPSPTRVAMAAGPLDMSVDGIGSGGIQSFSFGVANSGSASRAAGGAAGKASFQDIHVTRKTDSQSPQFMLGVASGKHFAKATLHLGPTTLNLTDVLINSYQASGTTNDATDQISLSFARIEHMAGNTNAKWDVVLNRAG